MAMYLFEVVLLLLLPGVCYSNQDRIRLQDLQVITLYHGRYTSARRSHAVPQVQCMGGTAGCSTFVPQVVQCFNRGFDGYDVQWECKTDMDNAYRFGQIAVNCEGYDYPDDPYVLRGSCGLEYYLELTKEGYQQHHSSDQKASYQYQKAYHSDNGIASTFVSVVMFIIAVIVIGSVVYMCQSHPHPDAPPPYPGPPGYTAPPHATAPPPAGFRSDYMPFSSGSADCSNQPGCGYDSSYRSGGVGTGTGAGFGGTGNGFWTGAAAGGLAGYLFGSRGQSRSYAHHATYQPPPQPTNSWWSSSSSTGGFASSSSASTGTRTASGFGGTKRR